VRVSINGSAQLATADVSASVEHIQAAAADGFRGYWLQQSGLVDALGVYVAAAPGTPGMELGTAVVPTFGQHPAALAAQALTAQAITGGRIALGIGLSHPATVEGRWGQRFERPVRHLTDYLDILQPLLANGAADHQGEVWSSVSGGPRPTTSPPPVLLAALGPQLLRICGQRAAGTVTWLAGPTTIAEHVVPILREAAEEARRPAPRVVCSLPIVVTDDVDAARRRIAAAIGAHAGHPSYRALLDREGAAGPADVAVLGDEAGVTDQLSALSAAGCTEFSAAELPGNPDEAERTRALLRRIALEQS
jgi:5,10-methylenetetrahydromethanopterin reductase